MRRAKPRHTYNVIRVLQERIADLAGHMTLHPDVPLTPEQEDNLARMQAQLREKEQEAKEKWGAGWIQAGLKDFHLLAHPGGGRHPPHRQGGASGHHTGAG
jgi:hypothetical protein